jgi:aminoglycoside 6'-N-acetyltransferase I
MSEVAFTIEPVRLNTVAHAAYRELRVALWPMPDDLNVRETAEILASERWGVFVARIESGAVVGFLEAGLREFAEGAESSPVAYLEGLYILPAFRRHGIGRQLVRAGEQWAISHGCTEIASDAQIDNAISIELHKRMGYAEVERQVCFLKRLPIRSAVPPLDPP